MKNAFINLELYNKEKIDNDNAPLLQLSSTNAQSVLENPEDYEFSIIRFSINSPLSFPLFMPDIQLDQPNPNLMTCNASLVFKAKRLNGTTTFTVKHTKQFIFIPQFLNQPVVPPIADVDYSSSQYYWVSTYQHIEHIFNYNLRVLHEETRSLIDVAISNDISEEFTLNSLSTIRVSSNTELPPVGFNTSSYASASSTRNEGGHSPELAFNKIYGRCTARWYVCEGLVCDSYIELNNKYQYRAGRTGMATNRFSEQI